MIAIIIQARMNSTRLPGKAMKKIQGKPMLEHVVRRSQNSKLADDVIVATSTSPEDSVIAEFCQKLGVHCFRGSLDNVLFRYYEAAKKAEADIVVRITSDCPLTDPDIIDLCIKKFREGNWDYVSNTANGKRTFPRGLDVEVLSFDALEKAYKNASEDYEREHVTPYVWQNKKKEFSVSPIISAPLEYKTEHRLTVDYLEDFELMKKIYNEFYKEGKLISVPKVISFLNIHPEIAKINKACVQKELK